MAPTSQYTGMFDYAHPVQLTNTFSSENIICFILSVWLRCGDSIGVCNEPLLPHTGLLKVFKMLQVCVCASFLVLCASSVVSLNLCLTSVQIFTMCINLRIRPVSFIYYSTSALKWKVNDITSLGILISYHTCWAIVVKLVKMFYLDLFGTVQPVGHMLGERNFPHLYWSREREGVSIMGFYWEERAGNMCRMFVRD